MNQKNETQLREEARTRKTICLYILEKKINNQLLVKEDLEKIAPDIYVPRLLSLYGSGPFEYNKMICEQLGKIIDSSIGSSYGWNNELISSLLMETGVSLITKMKTDFSRKPTGYYVIDGIFHNNFSFHIYGVLGTE